MLRINLINSSAKPEEGQKEFCRNTTYSKASDISRLLKEVTTVSIDDRLFKLMETNLELHSNGELSDNLNIYLEAID